MGILFFSINISNSSTSSHPSNQQPSTYPLIETSYKQNVYSISPTDSHNRSCHDWLHDPQERRHSIIWQGPRLRRREMPGLRRQQRCTKPFLVSKSTCYNIEWSTECTISHTTVEVKDAASGEMVYYRDTNGDWTPEKGELVYLDFKPKVWKTGNDTVEYKVTTCK